ncbi:MAG: DciA family protein [Bryobacteraceae bacterium]
MVGKLKLSAHGVSDEQLAIAAWPVAVGKKIALRTKSVSLVRDRLIIHVEDKIWQKQLFALRSQIVAALEKVLGRSIVGELEFRVAIPRRAPVVASTPRPLDEADSIKDPILRGIYVAARKKATA